MSVLILAKLYLSGWEQAALGDLEKITKIGMGLENGGQPSKSRLWCGRVQERQCNISLYIFLTL